MSHGVISRPAAFGSLPRADIANHRQNRRLAVDLNRRGIDVDGNKTPVLGAVSPFADEPAFRELLLEPSLEIAREFRGVDLAGRQLEQFFPTIPQSTASGRVRVENASGQIVNKHRVVDGIE